MIYVIDTHLPRRGEPRESVAHVKVGRKDTDENLGVQLVSMSADD